MQFTEFYGTLICKLLMFNDDKHVYTVNVGGSSPSLPTSLHLGGAEISPRQASCAANGLTSEPAWRGEVRSTKTAAGQHGIALPQTLF